MLAHTLGKIDERFYTCILATGSGVSVANQEILANPSVRFAPKKQIADHVIGVATFPIRVSFLDQEYLATVLVSSLHLQGEILLGMHFLEDAGLQLISWPNFKFSDGNMVPIEGDDETPKPKADFYSVFG